jgi:hypothetical protein
MDKQNIPTSSAPEVIIERAHGILTIKGWDRSELTATAASDTLKVSEQDDVVRMSCKSDCTVRLPHDASLRIETASATLRAKFIHDQISIGKVSGNLDLRDVAGVEVENVHGQFTGRRISGDVRADTVDGNVMLRTVHGSCEIARVKGNLDVRDIDGGFRFSTKGNARMRLASLAGSDYHIEATGNIHARIPRDASASLRLTSGAKSIHVKLSEGSQRLNQAEYELDLGEGGVGMVLSAGGSIYLSALESWEDDGDGEEAYVPFPEDFGEQIAEQVEAQIEAQMEAMNLQMNTQFERLSESISSAGLTEGEMERIMDQWRVSSERASERAQEKMERAQLKLERKIEAAKRKKAIQARAAAARQRGRKRGAWTFGVKVSPEPAGDPVSEEERMLILRMLEQKKISPAEAEKLLAALEGED